MRFFSRSSGPLVGAFILGSVAMCPLVARAGQPIELTVDASQAPTQSVVRTREIIPASAGHMSLLYPKWIPGEHGPVGPIENVASLQIHAGGQPIAWRRDPYDMFAIGFDVPAGVSSVEVDFTYLGATFGHYSSNRLSSPNLFVIDWNQNVLYPSTGTFASVQFNPTLILPGSDWKFATALYDEKRTGNSVTWSTTSLERLLDSPLDACTNFRQWELWRDAGSFPGIATLNVCADTAPELDASDKTVGHFKQLVNEMMAVYGARHWHDYHFLLTVSDVIPGEGVEHHESSDDGESGDYLIDATSLEDGGDLLSHEFNHSWDGKYRMPAGMYPKNSNLPLDDSLLWVYEGMTQYYGDVMSYRDGIRDPKNWPDHVAATWAGYDSQPGRQWRSLGDTAIAAPFLYGAPRGYGSERRSVDFYREGELLWLKVDSIIRERTNDKANLDTFARAFFGQTNTGPIVKTYDRADIILGLDAVAPYDWTGFFKTWVDDIAVHPPDGYTAEGWTLAYTDVPTHDVRKSNFTYSLGMVANNGMVGDVHFGSPAWKAGLGFGERIVAVNGRTYSDDWMYEVLKDAKRTLHPIQMIVARDDIYRTLSIPYVDGPRYPHLVRIDRKPDLLSNVVKPRVTPG
jgi:predicted metalloprotease with PDZ domain